MLFNKRQQRKESIVIDANEKVSIFPLAIPILAGPAAITSVIVIASDIGYNFFNQLVRLEITEFAARIAQHELAIAVLDGNAPGHAD